MLCFGDLCLGPHEVASLLQLHDPLSSIRIIVILLESLSNLNLTPTLRDVREEE